MAKPILSVGNADVINFSRLLRRSPRKLSATSASVLNTMAFKTRSEIISVIGQKMTVRNERFVSGSVRVEKARTATALNKQESVVGSIRRQRFSGWEEQITGQRSSRTRTATLAARGGNESRRIKPSFRAKPATDFISPDDFPGKSEYHRAIVMLEALKRRKERKPFIVRGHRKLKRGMYKFYGRKLRRLQAFERRGIKPKRVPWMGIARRRSLRQINVRKLWGDKLDKIFSD